jgi:hypothetical protein
MIQDLDHSLENLLVGEAMPGSELAGATISFAVPDKDWRAVGSGLELDVYLYRIAENRDLRQNERRLAHNADGTVTVVDFPVRLECFYLITAWNKGAEIPGVEKEMQEHRLLGQVLEVLFRNPTLPRAYLTGLLGVQEIDLPMLSAQPGDDAITPDFWSGLETYLRPSIHCRVTCSMTIARDVTGTQVTAIDTRIEGERMFMVGGTVYDGTKPVADAWVRIDPGGRVLTSDAAGRFRIDRLASGPYSLTVRAVGYQEAIRPIAVPQPDGIYDISLVPL